MVCFFNTSSRRCTFFFPLCQECFDFFHVSIIPDTAENANIWYTYMMDEINESDPRYVFFAKLRELIMEKDLENDEVAAAVLGWAYERLAE